MKLFAHPDCWKFAEEFPEDFQSFGCGPGGVGDSLVPDTMYGLNVSNACRIHDWYYRFYPSSEETDRKMADEILKNNLLRIVRKYSRNKFMRWLRVRRCHTYYVAVRVAGGPSFYKDRNTEQELRELTIDGLLAPVKIKNLG